MGSDEKYILDICDRVLGERGHRQHRFDFLRGLPSLKTGKRYMLPVDAYYPGRRLVIEYHEGQHTKSVQFWNKVTACGLRRDEQRQRYDCLRRDLLPKHGITLVKLDYCDFKTSARGRLRRTVDDEDIISAALAPYRGGGRTRLKADGGSNIAE